MAAEFFMGHVYQIDPNEYDKVFDDRDYAAEQYLHAEPWLNILSEDPESMPVRDHRKIIREYEGKIAEVERFKEGLWNELERFKLEVKRELQR